MADTRISQLTALTSVASGDLIPIVDVSDTTDSADGTTKVITQTNLIPDASESVKGKVELATDAETITGTDTARAVTPANIQAKVASTTAKGIIEIAIDSEVTTGTDATRAVSPDALAGSTIFGRKGCVIQVGGGTTDVAVGDGQAYFTVPEALNGMNLVRAQATVVTAGTTNATTVMIHNKTDAQDMLSGAISIASAGTVGTVGTINASFDDVVTNDVLRVDVDSVSTTAPKGLVVILEFQLP